MSFSAMSSSAELTFSRPPPKQFNADHPFVFLICTPETIVFMGTYVGY